MGSFLPESRVVMNDYKRGLFYLLCGWIFLSGDGLNSRFWRVFASCINYMVWRNLRWKYECSTAHHCFQEGSRRLQRGDL